MLCDPKDKQNLNLLDKRWKLFIFVGYFGRIMLEHKYIHKDKFEFDCGACLDGLEIVYHCSEKEYVKGDSRKVVWIMHALTANSDPTDWWSQLVGKGKLIDTEKYYVICANMLCSAYGSSGPASTDPATGKPYYFSFPETTVRDTVRAFSLLCRALGIEKIDLMLGASSGGFQAIEWLAYEPELIRKAILMATGPRVTPWCTANQESQRMALEADPSFRACESLKGGEMGLKCARAIAVQSYRSYEGYNLTQQEASEDAMFADRAGSYQRYQGKKLADRFDAYSYWYLTRMVDSNNVGRGRGGVEAALRSIRAEVCSIAISSDCLFPPQELKFIAENIQGAVYHEITSRFGHDGFLIENDQLTEIFRPVLESL